MLSPGVITIDITFKLFIQLLKGNNIIIMSHKNNLKLYYTILCKRSWKDFPKIHCRRNRT